nr:unnamed protein product [Callosobruchus analis]
MEISRDKVFISLSYSPRTATLKRKFGNLPIGYMRERIDKEEDFKILDRVGRRYHFNLLDEQVAVFREDFMSLLHDEITLDIFEENRDYSAYQVNVVSRKVFISVFHLLVFLKFLIRFVC